MNRILLLNVLQILTLASTNVLAQDLESVRRIGNCDLYESENYDGKTRRIAIEIIDESVIPIPQTGIFIDFNRTAKDDVKYVEILMYHRRFQTIDELPENFSTCDSLLVDAKFSDDTRLHIINANHYYDEQDKMYEWIGWSMNRDWESPLKVNEDIILKVSSADGCYETEYFNFNLKGSTEALNWAFELFE